MNLGRLYSSFIRRLIEKSLVRGCNTPLACCLSSIAFSPSVVIEVFVEVGVAPSGGALLPLEVAGDDALSVGRPVAIDGLEAALAVVGRFEVGTLPHVVLPLQVTVVVPPA